MKKLKFGIIGLGDIGRGHLKCLLACKEAEVVALCDIEPKQLDQVEYLGISKEEIKDIAFFKDYKKLLASKEIDAVCVCVPGYLHKEITVAALKSQKHVLVEKPLAHTLEDADEIILAEQESGKIVQVGLVYRYTKFFQKMKQIVRQGRLDEPEMMWCKEFRQPFPQQDWFYDSEKSGGAIVEKNTHHFDIFSWIIGARPTQVVAFGGQNVIKKEKSVLIDCSYCPEPPKKIKGSTILDNANILIEYENGAHAWLGLCLFLKPGSNSENYLEIGALGSNGTELMSNIEKGRLEICSGDEKEREVFPFKPPTYEFGHDGALESHYDFIRCVREGATPIASLKLARNALIVALAAEQSIKEKRIVEISEFPAYPKSKKSTKAA